MSLLIECSTGKPPGEEECRKKRQSQDASMILPGLSQNQKALQCPPGAKG